MILKIKAKIYQWFGINLAHREELEYLKSEEFWKTFMKVAGHKKNSMSARNIQGLLLGSWQAENGIARSHGVVSRMFRRWRIRRRLKRGVKK